MKTPIQYLSASLVAACLLAQPSAHAASSTALSNRTVVDSRDPYPVINLVARGIDVTKPAPDNTRLVSFQSPKHTLDRPFALDQKNTYYLQVIVPPYSGLQGGWGSTQAGIGVYYGLEMVTSGTIGPTDTIAYKIDQGIPSPSTPSSQWQPATFNGFVKIPQSGGTCYFKITLPGVGSYTSLKVQARFKSARLCKAGGGPVTSEDLDPSKPLWLLCHGKRDGENSMRMMNHAVAAANPGAQVVSVDWASGADGSILDLSSGRYFLDLARNLATLLREGEKYTPNQVNSASKVNWVGHSWGTLLGYETARAFGGVNRFIALDPALEAWNYKDSRVVFHKVSRASTGVRGGEYDDRLLYYGSESKAKTAKFAIRIVSDSPPPSIQFVDRRGFYHSLPRDWFINTMNKPQTDTFWPYFQEVMLRESERPEIPWAKKIATKGLKGFDIECYGKTSRKDDKIRFLKHHYLWYESPLGRNKKAYRDADYRWSTSFF